MSLLGFGVKNLRCLTDTGIVPIKPITLLVGRNSSGKSTFLKAFPLLRQSVKNARRSPVLWEDPDSVDFGNLELSINDRASRRTVTFGFAVAPEGEGADIAGSAERRLLVTLGASPESPYVESYVLQDGAQEVLFEFAPSHRVVRFEIDSHDALEGRAAWLGQSGYLIAPVEEHANGRLVYPPYVGATAPGVLRRRLVERTPADAWLTKLAQISSTLEACDHQIADFMYRVAYLGPERAVGARLYRLRDVAAEEVRPDGENLSNFMALLTPAEMESFAAFTRRTMGFEPGVRIDKLTAEILIKEAGAGPLRNIVDVGFGYAEVLPLCAVLWSTCVRELGATRRPASLVALEQPELHLHPAYQTKLARTIVGALEASREAGRELKIMVETHSEAIVNGLGDFVEDRVLSPDDVQIVLFDQDPATKQTQLRFAHYDERGALRGWPFGFFVPVEDEVFWNGGQVRC